MMQNRESTKGIRDQSNISLGHTLFTYASIYITY